MKIGKKTEKEARDSGANGVGEIHLPVTPGSVLFFVYYNY